MSIYISDERHFLEVNEDGDKRDSDDNDDSIGIAGTPVEIQFESFDSKHVETFGEMFICADCLCVEFAYEIDHTVEG